RAAAPAARGSKGPVTAVLAVLEQRDGALRKVSHEVVTGARRLADAGSGTVEALVLGGGTVSGADQLGRFGADRVTTATHAALGRYTPEGYTRVVVERVRARQYDAVVFPASATGRDLAPRVAARLGVPLAADVTDLGIEGGAIWATRPVYAGKALLKVRFVAPPALLSLRPNVFTPVERPRAGVVETASVDVPERGGRVVVREIKAAAAGALDVAEAPIVVSGGRGLKEPANFKLLEELARAFGGKAAVGAPGAGDKTELDVLIVGAGPAGLAAAIELARLAQAGGRDLNIGVLEKAGALGEHSLSGAVVNPRPFRELFPDLQDSQFPFRAPVGREAVYLLTARGRLRLPVPPTMHNSGNYVASLCAIVRWLGTCAEGLGVNVFTGFPAANLLVDGARVAGVRTAATGLDRAGQPQSSYVAPNDVLARVTALAEGTRGLLAQAYLEWQRVGSENPQIFALGVKEIWETKRPLDTIV